MHKENGEKGIFTEMMEFHDWNKKWKFSIYNSYEKRQVRDDWENFSIGH